MLRGLANCTPLVEIHGNPLAVRWGGEESFLACALSKLKIERTHSGGTAPVLHRLASDSRMVLELTL